MNTLCIIKPSKELLLEIKRYYPLSYRYDDWETVYLEGNIIMEDPFRGTFTIILHGSHTKVQLTVSPDQCNKVFVSTKKWR